MTTHEPEADEWVDCYGQHCRNGEWRVNAAERGWQPFNRTGWWLCPSCRIDIAQEG